MAKQEQEKCPILRAMGLSYGDTDKALDVCLNCPLTQSPVMRAVLEDKCVYETQPIGRPRKFKSCPKCYANDEWAFKNDDKEMECIHCGYVWYPFKPFSKPKSAKGLGSITKHK